MNSLHLVNIETLKTQLKQEKTQAKRITILYKLVQCLYPSDLTAAQQYAEEGIAMAQTEGDQRSLANFSDILAQVCRIHGQFSEALHLLEQSLHIREILEDKEKIANIYNSIGVINENQDNYAEALRYYSKSLDIYQHIKNEFGQANVLNNIGIIQFKRGNYIAALENYYSALEVYELLKLNAQLAGTLNNIGVIYKRQGDYKRAKYFYEKCLNIRQELGDKSGMALSFMNIGNLYKEQEEYNKALDYHQQSLMLRVAIDDRETGSSHLAIAATLVKLDQLEVATSHYLNAWKLSRELLISSMEVNAVVGLAKICAVHKQKAIIEEMIRREMGEAYQSMEVLLHNALHAAEKIEHVNATCILYKSLADFYRQKEDFAKAYQFLEKHITTNNQLLDAQKLETINNLRNKHELEQKEKLQKINSELEETIRIRTEQLTMQNLQLKEYARIVAHDLKEPVRNIGTFANLLKKQFADTIDDEVKEYLHFILFNTNHIEQLLKDLMSYTILSNNEIADCQPVSLNQLLENLTHLLHARIQESGTRLEIANMPPVKVQETHLKQLFQNLLQNAIKFRCKNVPCVIKMNYIEQEKSYLFSVKDNGIGIPTASQQEVFRLFNRLDKKRFEGTGVGLAICKKIVNMYGGNIWLESEEGTGTTFFFTLPK